MPHDPPHAPTPDRWPLITASSHPEVMEKIRQKYPEARAYAGCPGKTSTCRREVCGEIGIAVTSDRTFERVREEAYLLIDDYETVELVRPLVTRFHYDDPVVVLLWPH